MKTVIQNYVDSTGRDVVIDQRIVPDSSEDGADGKTVLKVLIGLTLSCIVIMVAVVFTMAICDSPSAPEVFQTILKFMTSIIISVS